MADGAQGDDRQSCPPSCGWPPRSASKRSTCSASVFFDRDTVGLARPDQALFERMNGEEAHGAGSRGGARQVAGPYLQRAPARPQSPGSASARRATTARGRYAGGRGRSCISPPTAAPCPAASRPSRQHGYENYTLGDATQETLREIWNGPRYQSFREGLLSDTRRKRAPTAACAGACDHADCGCQLYRNRRDPLPRRGRADRRRRARGARAGCRRGDRGRQRLARCNGRARARRAARAWSPSRRAATAAPARPACAQVRADTDIVCFLDGDGSDVPQFIADVVGPVARGKPISSWDRVCAASAKQAA